MRFHALACDYDGTLATHGRVGAESVAALERLRASGRKLILVTGRQLEELLQVFPEAELFDRIVAENGALLFRPATKEEVVLSPPPPPALAETLRAKGVAPLAIGRVILATWEPYQLEALEAIRDLSLEMQVIFNKGAVMLLPSGVNKATGLAAALSEMGLSTHNTVCVGDAENDHALFSIAECAVAVQNAVDSLKENADLVTEGDHGAGVAELIDRLIATDLKELEPKLGRHHILAGTVRGAEVALSPFQNVVLIVGTSGGGKTTLAAGILQRLAQYDYQVCIVDPEGDYADVDYATGIGDAHRAPTAAEVASLLDQPIHSVAINLLAVPLSERPAVLRSILAGLQEIRTHTGRPHWLALDEAHHLLPSSGETHLQTLAQGQSLLLLTVDPECLSPELLSTVRVMMVIGATPQKSIQAFAERIGAAVPKLPEQPLEQGECLLWMRAESPDVVEVMQSIPSASERRRHRRKYAEGELPEDRSFYFRGAERQLNLRAHNLILFIRIAEGIGDDVWLYHLNRGDYTRWFREAIKDEKLAAQAEALENRSDISAAESRAVLGNVIQSDYTLPARGNAGLA